jgi:hypothetical protein
MGTIPASQLVNVLPSVQDAGGSAVDIVGLCLTNGSRIPLGSVLSFASAAAVASYFGAGSTEARIAGGGSGFGSGYFGGFENSGRKPANLLMAQYNTVPVGAWLRGGSVASLTLTQLQAINGTLSIVIDGVTKSGSVNLAGVTSFSNAATKIADTLDIEGGAQTASFTATQSGTTLTVTAVGSGTLSVGDFVDGSGVDPATYITALGSGTGGTGTYTVSVSQTVGAPTAMTAHAPGVTYDSVSGGFQVNSATTGITSTIAYATGTVADDLMLQAAQGAVISQGAAAAVPATFMNALIASNRNWATFFTSFDPDGGSGNTLKLAFAAWTHSTTDRFAYVCWDTDITPTTTLPATTSLGYLIAQAGYNGTCLIYDATDLNIAAFISGAAASIDFTERNGRISFAYRQQSGLVASVSDPTVASNLAGTPQTSDIGNGYNFYGAYANANQNFLTFQRGFVSGTFDWLDSYINQIWFNSFCQSALLNLLVAARSIPYDDGGRTAIEAALKDPIDAALNFGMFGPGPLSNTQIAAVNGAAGVDIASTLQTQGYFLQVLPATAAVRAARTTPPAKLWYIDKGAVQAITLSSIALQ